jgi:hypothetical protein
VLLSQIFGLIFEVIEIGMGWEASYRHANFLS